MSKIINPLPESEQAYIWPLIGTRMLELGNKRNKNGVYKSYFKSLGINHVSIDWNGEDGALPLDLREPINMEPFDMVTNIGTTEHVDDQYQVWENIHNLTKVGGVICSGTPLPGDWRHHGFYYVYMEFFDQYLSNGYKMEFQKILGNKPSRLVCVRMKKYKHNNFTMPEDKWIYENIKP